jgi:Ig-like domain CHU_C associated
MRSKQIRYVVTSLLVVALLLVGASAAQAGWRVLSDVGFEDQGTCLDGSRFALADADTTVIDHYHLYANRLPADTELVGSLDFTLPNNPISTVNGDYIYSGVATIIFTQTMAVSDTLLYHFATVPDSGGIGSPDVEVQNCHLVDLPQIMTQPASKTIYSGQTTALNVIASGKGPLTFEWFEGGLYHEETPVGGNSSTFTTPVLTDTTTYWVRVTNAYGHANSIAATITVSDQPGILTQPASKTIRRGQSATLNVTAVGVTPYTYQWYQGTASDTSTPVGTNSASFTTPPLTSTTAYWVRVSNPNGAVNSTTATITVTNDVFLPIIRK